MKPRLEPIAHIQEDVAIWDSIRRSSGASWNVVADCYFVQDRVDSQLMLACRLHRKGVHLTEHDYAWTAPSESGHFSIDRIRCGGDL